MMESLPCAEPWWHGGAVWLSGLGHCACDQVTGSSPVVSGVTPEQGP